MRALDRYVGLPVVDHGRDLAGVDCWGLVRLVYGAELDIVLPSYTGAYASTGERAQIARLATKTAQSGPWRPIDAPRLFDVLWFRMGRHACHVSLYAGAGLMLHAHTEQTKMVRLHAPDWKDRFLGAYRHEAAL